MAFSSLIKMRQLQKIFGIRLHTAARQLMGVKAQQLKMPALSPTMTEGTIVKWLKKEGDAISPGDALCDIQTDKAVMTFELEESGVLARILVPDDTKDVKIGTLIALMVEEGEDWKDVDVPSGETVKSVSPATPTAATTTAAATASKNAHSVQIQLGPAARTLLDAYSLEPSQISTSGPHGILLKGDVLKFISANKLKPKPAEVSKAPKIDTKLPKPMSPKPTVTTVAGQEQSFVDVPNTNIRQVIARRLTESKTTIPHSYCTVDCHMDSIVALRKQLKGEGIKVSVNDFIIKAAAVALQRVPKVNAQWTNAGLTLLSNIDVSVAVASESGLITPIIKDAVGLGVADISKQMKELSDKAKKGKLQPHEFMGGTFTISNLGMFGITEFSAIINPPQSAILAIGTSRIIVDDNGNPKTRMNATMSYDGRVFGEDVAAHFLEEFAILMANPSLLLAAVGPVQMQSVNVH